MLCMKSHLKTQVVYEKALKKMLVELNSQLITSYSLQIPEGQVCGHLHLLPEKLCLQEKERRVEQTQSRDGTKRPVEMEDSTKFVPFQVSSLGPSMSMNVPTESSE